MKIFNRIISLILCAVLFFTINITGVQAASVKVSAPGTLKATSTADTVKLTWKKVSKAKGYKVYRIVNGKAKLLKTINNVKTIKYTVEGLTASEKYKFSVRSYITQGGKTYLSSNKYVEIKTKPLGNTPKPKATVTKNSVTLKWSEVPGATGYTVHQLKDGKWVKIKTVTAKTYKVSSLKVDQTYKFKIRPYAKTTSGNVNGKYSAVVSAKTVDKTKAKFSTPIVSAKSAVLIWNEVPDATGYRLKMLKDGVWVTVGDDIKETSFYVSDLKSDTEYSFYVVGIKTANGKTTLFTKSDTLKIRTKQDQTTTPKPGDNNNGDNNKPDDKPNGDNSGGDNLGGDITDLKPFRLEKYKNIIEKDNLYFEILSEYDEGKKATIVFAQKNGNLYMKIDMEGISLKITYDKAKDEMNLWMGIPIKLTGEMKTEMMDIVDEMLNIMQVNIIGEITIYRTTFNKKPVICESFYDSKTRSTMNYYFENDNLIGIEKIYAQNVAETVIVSSVSNDVDDIYFNRDAIPFL